MPQPLPAWRRLVLRQPASASAPSISSPPPVRASPMRCSPIPHTPSPTVPHCAQDPFFHPMLGSLVKLVFLSSALHQAAFAALSSMPFAVGEAGGGVVGVRCGPVCCCCAEHGRLPALPCALPAAGQVQDVGLIFLSAMASAVVQQCGEAGWPQGDTLATVLATLTLATGAVGILIVGTGARWFGMAALADRAACTPSHALKRSFPAAACRRAEAGGPGAVRAAAGGGWLPLLRGLLLPGSRWVCSSALVLGPCAWVHCLLRCPALHSSNPARLPPPWHHRQG